MSRKLEGKDLERHEEGRDIGQEILDSVEEISGGGGRRYTLVPKTAAARARMKAGLSQAQFAELLGVSIRTLQQWEQGRREPSGASKTLIRIADMKPEVLREVML